MDRFDSCADAQQRLIFDDEISDRALELAAAVVRDGGPNMTVAFCSGLDECPHRLPRGPAQSV